MQQNINPTLYFNGDGGMNLNISIYLLLPALFFQYNVNKQHFGSHDILRLI